MRRISGAGLARERIPARAKTAAWWDLPDAASRAAEITARASEWNTATSQIPAAGRSSLRRAMDRRSPLGICYGYAVIRKSYDWKIISYGPQST
jgi:hypothetical protein